MLDNKIEELERKHESVQKRLVKLAADLEAVRRTREIVGGGSGSAAPGRQEGSGADLARRAIGQLRGQAFSVDAVVELVAQTVSDNDMPSRSSVSSALARMADNGELTVVAKRRGRRAAKYAIPESSDMEPFGFYHEPTNDAGEHRDGGPSRMECAMA
ncbi:MAG: hypothetical protein KDA21_01465 [Phycisphaerales bacterium]|nr:hypothetical protein [Phycisphaerales bacterium]